MLIFRITPTDPYFEATADIDGVSYILDLLFDFRASRWAFNISTNERELLAAGVRLIPGTSLLASFSDPRLPVGEFHVTSNKGDREPPEFDDLGNGCALVYLDTDDVAALATLQRVAEPFREVRIEP